MLWMALVHTHHIRMRPGASPGGDGRPHADFPALTQRNAADIIAGLWSEHHPHDRQRSDYRYWYHVFNTQTPYEVFEDIPEQVRPRFMELRRASQGPARRGSRARGVIGDARTGKEKLTRPR